MGGGDLGAVVQQRAAKGLVVTTSFFTRNAIATAEESRVRNLLRDQKALLTWIDSLPHSHDR
jgi:restriction system protein